MQVTGHVFNVKHRISVNCKVFYFRVSFHWVYIYQPYLSLTFMPTHAHPYKYTTR